MSLDRRHVAIVVQHLSFAPGTGFRSIHCDPSPITGDIPVLPRTQGTVGGEVVSQIVHRNPRNQTGGLAQQKVSPDQRAARKQGYGV